MAIKTACHHCKKRFSAPEDYLGKKVECPRCGRRSVLRSPADLEEEAERRASERRRLDEDKERIALIERENARGRKGGRQPYYEQFQTGTDGVRHFNPRAPSRFMGFRALSDLLVLAAYVELFLVAAGIGLTFYLWVQGWLQPTSVLVLLVIVWLIVGIALYLLLKYLGELAFVLAEAADRQADTVQLLLDLRENTDQNEASS